MCTTCSECVSDVYVGLKTHLCNIHTRPCTSAHNTCKVHVTLLLVFVSFVTVVGSFEPQPRHDSPREAKCRARHRCHKSSGPRA